MIPAAAAMRQRYRELSMPLVIMAGRKDKVAKVGGQSVRLHEAIPHSSIRLVPNVGHMLHYAAPEEVVAVAPCTSTTGPKRRLQGPESTRNTLPVNVRSTAHLDLAHPHALPASRRPQTHRGAGRQRASADLDTAA